MTKLEAVEYLINSWAEAGIAVYAVKVTTDRWGNRNLAVRFRDNRNLKREVTTSVHLVDGEWV
jgi:hypothetical protein